MAITVKSSWKGGQVQSRVRAAAVRGVNRAAERLRGLSVAQTPLRDGPLRASAFVQPAEEAENLIHAAVGFDTVYAAIQHEAMSFRHTDGKAKYLEDPTREHAKELIAIVAAEVRRAL